jgi:tetrahydromethanopterin S-methyltransferase subunit G
MFGLPMEIAGPVIGIGAIIAFIVAGQVILRLVPPRIAQHKLESRIVDPTEHGRVLEDVQVRLGELDQLKQRIDELEERVDFAERLLAKHREEQRLGPSQD